MKTETPNPRQAAEIVVQKLDKIIAEKRAPLLELKNHIDDLDRQISSMEDQVTDYLRDPSPAAFKVAVEAETQLVSARSIRSRIGQLNTEAVLATALNKAFEAGPLFDELASANSDYLKLCRDRCRQFRIEAASLDDTHLLEWQIKIWSFKLDEAEKLTKAAGRWAVEWAQGGVSEYWNFWAIYRALRKFDVELYGDISELPIPENYCPPQAAVLVCA